MKRIVLLIVSAALVLSCFVFGTTMNGTASAGAGIGFNKKVKTAEELAEVLEFLMEQNGDENSLYSEEGMGYVLSADDGSVPPINLLASNEKKSKKSGKSKEDEYVSATLVITTDMSSSSTCDNPEYSGGVSSTSQSLQRELTMYITEEGTLYQSSGTERYSRIATKKNKDGGREQANSYRTMNFDMQIFTTGKKTYVNFREFSYVTNTESMQIRYEYTNQWIEMPEDIVEDMVDLDGMNRSVLSAFGEILSYMIESGWASEDDKIISVDENDIAAIYEEMEDSYASNMEDYDISFKYDLSSASSPTIYESLVMDSSDTNEIAVYDDEYNGYYGGSSYHTVSVTTTSKVKATEQIIIKNINNTVINFDEDKVDLEIKTEKDAKRIFIIEERKDEQ